MSVPIIIPLVVHGHRINIYDFIHDSPQKAWDLREYFQRMPAVQIPAIYPIFVVDLLPRHGRTGGTWWCQDVRGRWEGQEHCTGVSMETLTDLVIRPETGLIAIPRNRWEALTHHVTVFHEVAHSIDHWRRLYPPGTTHTQFNGIKAFPLGTNSVGEHAVEAYARVIYRARTLCRQDMLSEIPEGNLAGGDRRVERLLQRSPAFQGVATSWWRDMGRPVRVDA